MMIALALLAAAAIGVAPAQNAVAPVPDAAAAVFTVGTRVFEMPLPPSLCLPRGQEIEDVKSTAAADKDNVLHLMLFTCDQNDARYDRNYMFLKTQKLLIGQSIERKAILNLVSVASVTPEVKALMRSDKITREAEKRLTDALGKKVNFTGGVKLLGSDDVCGYLIGQGRYDASDATYSQGFGVCVTAVEGTAISVYRYGADTSPSGLLSLAKEARRIALTIKPRLK